MAANGSHFGTKKGPDQLLVDRVPGKKVPAVCYSPAGEPRSTLAEDALHFRVRNGNGCFVISMATGKKEEDSLGLSQVSQPDCDVVKKGKPLGVLVPVS